MTILVTDPPKVLVKPAVPAPGERCFFAAVLTCEDTPEYTFNVFVLGGWSTPRPVCKRHIVEWLAEFANAGGQIEWYD